ncbi:peptide-methionine (S)-S-oxide reductase MsrA [Hymenobacter sp.]|uniref:peptide-methionine (S)-S-oxide reductase MsrA n=1 Tax=Hymenobacter sp. TaxID=1898978 RepID=UPI00286D2386|nr:peptide-methionine (S)-S-oxide reductase MsrA [Hymenobacter sp.]
MKNRLKSLAGLSALAFLFACGTQQPADAQNPPRSTAGFAPTDLSGLATATFAGGCFWAQEEAFEQLKGVQQVVSGYAGGTKANPTYEQVSDKTTGHTETVQIYYDPRVISYQKLADIFFTASHDPTQLNRQGPDAGPEYRSAAFYRTPEEKKILEATIAKVNAAKMYSSKIVTEVVPFQKFWPAEAYHQGYYRLHPENPYIGNVSAAKVEHVRKAFDQDIKTPL